MLLMKIDETIKQCFKKEAFRDRVTQISCTADPSSHAYLTMRSKSERNSFVKTLRHSSCVVGLVGRKMCPQAARICKISHTLRCGDPTPSDLHRQKNKNLKRETRGGGENRRRHLEVPERGIFANQYQDPASNRSVDDVKKLVRTTARRHTQHTGRETTKHVLDCEQSGTKCRSRERKTHHVPRRH